MDDVTLGSLEGALAASPENAQLLSVVLRELLTRGQAEKAVTLVQRAGNLEAAPADVRAVAGR
ncbi:MAG: hypothetical protein K0R38_7540, partial [Polyangiaceae bacterium]|nr:hypothetical protein [Polyangiaceae bacterium]